MTKSASGASESATGPVVSAIALGKSYGGLRALDAVSLDIFPGEILALIGDNGTGKSTLVKALAGAQPPDSGEIRIDGRPAPLRTPRDAAAHKVGCLHQGLGLRRTLGLDAGTTALNGVVVGERNEAWAAISRGIGAGAEP